MTREEKIAVVESYIHGLGNGDFSHVPFADDVSYESPLTPKRTGQDAIAFLAALFPIMRGKDSLMSTTNVYLKEQTQHQCTAAMRHSTRYVGNLCQSYRSVRTQAALWMLLSL